MHRIGRNRVWLEINLSTLRENFVKISEAVSPAEVIAVLKANAYGLGVKKIAQTLSDAGAAGFGVAEINEALELSGTGKPVQILGAVLPSEIPEAVNANIIMPVQDLRTAQMISDEAVRQKKTAECHFLVDTGMGRLGMLAKDAENIIKQCVGLPAMKFSGIYSHFPTAYRTADDFTEKQCAQFMRILENLKKTGITFEKIHIANSDAVNNFPLTYCNPFNFVRVGINLYGAFDNEGRRILNLKSVVCLKSRVVSVRTLPAGSSIGYGRTFQLLKDTRIATVSAGYADALPLALSNRGFMVIKGRLCPVAGRVSMDYTTVSLDNVPEDVVPGDEVICIGGEYPNEISVENWAQLKGTHSYDIICAVSARAERHYIG